MKTHYLSVLLAAFLLACSGGSEVEKKQQELAKLKKEQKDVTDKVKQLEEELAVLAPKKTNEARIKPVKTAPVTAQTFNHFIEVQGTVDSDKNILVTPKTGGTITRVHVNEGDRVKAGQVMAEIDDAVLRQNAEEIKTSLTLLTTIYERQKNLWDQKIGSEVQFLQAKNSKEAQERRLQTLNSQLAQARITSPINGVVDEVRIKPGEGAMPGVGVIRVVNLSGIKVLANVADSYIAAVKKGDAVTIRIPDTGQQLQGKVSFVGQVVNSTSRTFPI
ncbi:MAG: efflux RND transporter periplasmic adaptor subunit, partial [Ferruginibacter sp.]|nr:efflux RND transporter periplasmic adaptor subunit [Cytophagales bacterium]